ncbi:MAG: hypothetical protein CM1200mP22_24880 [Dehalococcoidia bacterium]|nr:MAG: hypothetical protein CM1200mP22_24880 [Dehalococcoidia bacterium]
MEFRTCSRFATPQSQPQMQNARLSSTSVAEGERIANTLQTKVDFIIDLLVLCNRKRPALRHEGGAF